jgi:hypothetical protein
MTEVITDINTQCLLNDMNPMQIMYYVADLIPDHKTSTFASLFVPNIKTQAPKIECLRTCANTCIDVRSSSARCSKLTTSDQNGMLPELVLHTLKRLKSLSPHKRIRSLDGVNPHQTIVTSANTQIELVVKPSIGVLFDRAVLDAASNPDEVVGKVGDVLFVDHREKSEKANVWISVPSLPDGLEKLLLVKNAKQRAREFQKHINNRPSSKVGSKSVVLMTNEDIDQQSKRVHKLDHSVSSSRSQQTQVFDDSFLVMDDQIDNGADGENVECACPVKVCIGSDDGDTIFVPSLLHPLLRAIDSIALYDNPSSRDDMVSALSSKLRVSNTMGLDTCVSVAHCIMLASIMIASDQILTYESVRDMLLDKLNPTYWVNECAGGSIRPAVLKTVQDKKDVGYMRGVQLRIDRQGVLHQNALTDNKTIQDHRRRVVMIATNKPRQPASNTTFNKKESPDPVHVKTMDDIENILRLHEVRFVPDNVHELFATPDSAHRVCRYVMDGALWCRIARHSPNRDEQLVRKIKLVLEQYTSTKDTPRLLLNVIQSISSSSKRVSPELNSLIQHIYDDLAYNQRR